MPQVNEFNGYYIQIVSDHHSGWSDTQIIQGARLNWKNAHKKREFPYTHVWKMVKDEPKLAAQVGTQNASKKTKTSDSGAYTSSSHHDQEDNTHEGNESESRPIGQKAAKRKMRGKEKKDIADYEILIKDTSKMSDQQLIIHNHMCSIIKARHGIS
uniref:No apical meristem-associated C-terminal domain-containing protein n=1 Tax=Kalanchoe fedtschenkoi TaxID=63787 RepID=A0A7N0T852_KALFE